MDRNLTAQEKSVVNQLFDKWFKTKTSSPSLKDSKMVKHSKQSPATEPAHIQTRSASKKRQAVEHKQAKPAKKQKIHTTQHSNTNVMEENTYDSSDENEHTKQKKIATHKVSKSVVNMKSMDSGSNTQTQHIASTEAPSTSIQQLLSALLTKQEAMMERLEHLEHPQQPYEHTSQQVVTHTSQQPVEHSVNADFETDMEIFQIRSDLAQARHEQQMQHFHDVEQKLHDIEMRRKYSK